jgi:hypothetical protein
VELASYPTTLTARAATTASVTSTTSAFTIINRFDAVDAYALCIPIFGREGPFSILTRTAVGRDPQVTGTDQGLDRPRGPSRTS